MATALKPRSWEASIAELAPPRRPVNELAPVRPRLPGITPERVIVREITFLMDSDGLQFLYRGAVSAVRLGEGGIDEVVRGLATAPYDPFVAPAALNDGDGETPLDLGVTGEPAYIVFKLDPRLNWRFSDNEAGISHKHSAETAYYGGLQHVLPDGSYAEEPVEDCRLVFLTANPPPGEYKHGFNFHVELVQKPLLGKTQPRFLPITIDPDIRFPGGSET